MSNVTEAAVQAVELEAFNKSIPDLVYTGKTLKNLIKKSAKTYPTANITTAAGTSRPAFRIPVYVQSGGSATQGTGNGDSLGTGNMSQWTAGDLAPVFLFQGCQITYLSQMATSGPKRAMISVRAQELKNTLDTFERAQESLFNSDGTGTLDTIPSTATVNNATGGGTIGTATYSSIVGLNNANQFADQQTVIVYPGGGGGARGTFVISYANGVDNTIYSTTALPAGTTTGDTLALAGTAGTSVQGIQAWQVSGNVGNTPSGIVKANFPGRFSTPQISLSGPVNTSVPYRAQILIERGLGEDTKAAESFIWYVPPTQALAISNLYTNVLIANAQEVKGENALDIVKKNMAITFGGHEVVKSYNAVNQSRLDGLCLSEWGVLELKETSLYDFGNGVTTMPLPDIDNGGYLSSSIFYYNWAGNLFNANQKAGVYVTGATAPTI